MTSEAAKNDLVSKLSMDHLKDTKDLVADVEEAVEGKRPEIPDPRGQREYTFDFKWDDSSGKLWSGKFTSRILTLGEQSLVGVLRAKLSANVPYDSLDDFTKELNFLVATLTYALKDRPKWADDLRKLDDIALLQALYAEVSAHEATFRGQRKVEEGSQKIS